MKEIELMIKEDIETGKLRLQEAIEEKDKVITKLKNEGKSTTERIIGWDGRAYTVPNKEYQEVIEKYKYYLKLKSMYGIKGAEERIEKDIREHYKNLQLKVEKKIGKILKITPTGNNGYDYYMKGENGNCNVEVILAGGYNIQRLHTRWIIK